MREAQMAIRGRRGSAGRAVAVQALLLAAILLAASSSSGSSKAGTTSPTGGGNLATTTSAGSNPAKSASGGTAVTVDLVVTGDRPFTIKGTKGSCSIPSNDSLVSSYNFTGDDYPSLGAKGIFSVAGPQKATAGGQLAFAASIKALIKGAGFLDTAGRGITVSADRTKVTLDTDISGGTAGTISNPGTPLRDHVTGTITCR
jgi:hypothetical protein